MDKEKLVSVIIPTYKRADMLCRAIDSVLNQTYKEVQIVVVDDNNPDTEFRYLTQKLMERYSENSKVKYICHESNKNGAVARNTGIENSDGEMLCFLDDDDYFMPSKIEEQVRYLERHPQYHAVYCGFTRDGKTELPKLEGNLCYEYLSGDVSLWTDTIMIRKEDAIACGGWDTSLKRHQEAGFLLRYMDCGGKIGVVSKNLVFLDVSDRSNEPENPQINEKYTLFYLQSYEYIIEKISLEDKKNRKKIYLHRYRGILLHYLKARDIKGACSFYVRKCLNYPFSFNISMVGYVFTKLRGR